MSDTPMIGMRHIQGGVVLNEPFSSKSIVAAMWDKDAKEWFLLVPPGTKVFTTHEEGE